MPGAADQLLALQVELQQAERMHLSQARLGFLSGDSRSSGQASCSARTARTRAEQRLGPGGAEGAADPSPSSLSSGDYDLSAASGLCLWGGRNLRPLRGGRGNAREASRGRQRLNEPWPRVPR